MAEKLRRIVWVVLSLAFLCAVLIAAFGALALPLRDVFPAYFILLLLLFCFVPQGLLLRALKIRSHTAWISFGVLSGWLTLILGNLGWFHAMAPEHSFAELREQIFSNPGEDFAKLAIASLVATGTISGLVAWLWRLRSDPAVLPDEGNTTPRHAVLPPWDM